MAPIKLVFFLKNNYMYFKSVMYESHKSHNVLTRDPNNMKRICESTYEHIFFLEMMIRLLQIDLPIGYQDVWLDFLKVFIHLSTKDGSRNLFS